MSINNCFDSIWCCGQLNLGTLWGKKEVYNIKCSGQNVCPNSQPAASLKITTEGTLLLQSALLYERRCTSGPLKKKKNNNLLLLLLVVVVVLGDGEL